MSLSETTEPKFKSSWWSLLVYFGFFIFSLMGLFVPIVVILKFRGEDSYNAFIEDPSILGQLTMVVAGFLATYIMVIRYEKRDWSSLQLTISIRELVRGFAIGVTLMVLFVCVSQTFNLIDFKFSGFSTEIIFGFFLYSLVAVAEEVIFRGYILANLRDKLSSNNALIVSSLLFGLAHLGNDHLSFVGILTISLSGFLMGMLTLRYKTISGAVGFHWSWNFFQGSVFGLSVSGNPEKGLFIPEFLSKPLWTGTDFGAEGSLILCIITLLSIYLMTKSAKSNTSKHGFFLNKIKDFQKSQSDQ